MSKNTNALCSWDLTIPKMVTINGEITQLQPKDISEWFNEIAKAWSFQLEKGKSGYVHYQCRISLKVKARLSTLQGKKKWSEVHFSPTSNANSDNFYYTEKNDTRIEGPWNDTNQPVNIPSYYNQYTTWYPWQQDFINKINNYIPENRTIHIIWDKKGKIGKTILCNYLGASNIATTLPYCKEYKDILRMAMDQPVSKVYFIDLPRSLPKKNLNELYAGIETLKGGFAFDDRYHFKKRYFNPPMIVVFSNILPDLDYLSADRWKIWRINKKKELKKHIVNNTQSDSEGENNEIEEYASEDEA